MMRYANGCLFLDGKQIHGFAVMKIEVETTNKIEKRGKPNGSIS